MDREPTKAEKAVAGFASGMTLIAIFGVIPFVAAIGISRFDGKLGIAIWAFYFAGLMFHTQLARRPLTKQLGVRLESLFVRLILSKGR